VLGEVTGHALAALAVSRRLADLAVADRWETAAAALATGASLAEVASACGLDPGEVVSGYRAWLDNQRRAGVLTPAECERIGDLLRRQPGTGAS